MFWWRECTLCRPRSARISFSLGSVRFRALKHVQSVAVEGALTILDSHNVATTYALRSTLEMANCGSCVGMLRPRSCSPMKMLARMYVFLIAVYQRSCGQRATASLSRLQALNPNVKIVVDTAGATYILARRLSLRRACAAISSKSEAFFQSFSAVCVIGQSLQQQVTCLFNCSH